MTQCLDGAAYDRAELEMYNHGDGEENEMLEEWY